MTTTYSTKDGDMVDAIAHAHYGTTEGQTVQAVLDANPGLVDYGPTLPAGVRVLLPVIVTTGTVQGIALWD